jgi:hypothetical protein
MTAAMAHLVLGTLALTASVAAVQSNPIGKVLELLSNLESKITAEGEEAQKMHDEMTAWCHDREMNLGFDIKTGKSDVAALSAAIAKQDSLVSAGATKVEELSSGIAANEADLKAATAVRTEEAATFAAEEKELGEVIDTLDRAVAVLSRAGSSLMQVKNAKNVVEAFRLMVDASVLSTADASRLTALVQSQSSDEDGDAGAPDAAVYVSHSGSIVDTIEGLKEKAEEQLSDARRKESTANHNFDMLRQSLEDEIKYSNKDLAETKKAIAAATEAKATAEGDLAVTSKDLSGDETELADTSADCASKTADFEAAVASRTDELKALGEAKKVVSDMTAGAEKLSYGLNQVSLLQMSTAADLAQFEAVRFVRDLAKKQHSVALDQLATRMSSALKLGGPFDKVKSLISDMIARLEEQGSADASHKEYCDEELSESEAKKTEKNTLIEKISTKIDQMTSRSAQLQEEVASLEKALAAIAASQAESDKLRQEEHAVFTKNKAEMEQGVEGVQMALKIIREYYAAEGKAHSAADGASSGIVGLLEVCLSDFTKGLAEMMATEDSAATSYAKSTMENKLETTAKSQDVKYKAADSAKLDKAVAEATSDRSSAQDELDAVMEYLAKLKEQCVAKAETYSERKARRDAELAGLKQALEILEGQSLLQATRGVLRGVRAH